MTRALFFQAIGKVLAGLLLVALLLFIPAGTLHYRNAWLLIALLFVPMFLAGLVMMVKSGYFSDCPEATDAGIKLVRIRRKVKERKNETD